MRQVIVSIIADDEGIVAGTDAVRQAATELGLSVDSLLDEGSPVSEGNEIGRFSGTPKQVAVAEERLIGLMAKPSGIATAARRFVEKAGRRPEIVSGAWKKMPGSEKGMIRRAIITGGARYRISREPFIFLDKNYVKMLGGVSESLRAVADLNGHLRVVQLKGFSGDIALEVCEAVECGADIVFIDSGKHDDLRRAGAVSSLAAEDAAARYKLRVTLWNMTDNSLLWSSDMESYVLLEADTQESGAILADTMVVELRKSGLI